MNQKLYLIFKISVWVNSILKRFYIDIKYTFWYTYFIIYIYIYILIFFFFLFLINPSVLVLLSIENRKISSKITKLRFTRLLPLPSSLLHWSVRPPYWIHQLASLCFAAGFVFAPLFILVPLQLQPKPPASIISEHWSAYSYSYIVWNLQLLLCNDYFILLGLNSSKFLKR